MNVLEQTILTSSMEIAVTEQGQAGEARRLAQAWAQAAGCGEEFSSRVSLAVTELAKNLALHTERGGSLVLRRLGDEHNCGVSILSLDRGPGLENFARCLTDGYSTAGTAGTGLGAVQRLAKRFEVHSQPKIGSALYAELWAKGSKVEATGTREQLGVVSVPMRGESASGDAWGQQHGPGWSRFMIADGLGHGPIAAEAALVARDVFLAGAGSDLPNLLKLMHQELRGSRGAAVGVVHLEPAQEQLRFAGIGNISAATIRNGQNRCLISHNGTLGAALPHQPSESLYPWSRDRLLLLHSDGLKHGWNLARYPGLSVRHPELIAGVLFRDYPRGKDDTTILVIRQTS